MRLGGFDDLLRPQAAGADFDPPHPTPNHRPHGLQVWLQPSLTDVMGVTHLTTDDGTLAAKLTTLGHLVPSSTLSVEHRLLDPAPDGGGKRPDHQSYDTIRCQEHMGGV